MVNRIAKFSALASALLLLPLAALAHGSETDNNPTAGAPNTTKPSQQQSSSKHAEALGEPGDPKAQARTVLVTMSDEMRFVPNRLEIRKGETIRFMIRNPGKLKHELVLGTRTELEEHAKVMQKIPEMEHEDPNAASAEPGKNATLAWKFTKLGEFMFGCLVPGHFEGGMVGTIVVK